MSPGRAMYNESHMQVVVDSLLATYERAGTGKTLLVLHGWGDSSQGWRTFVSALEREFEVVVPDLPGFGGTEAPAAAWGLDEYVAFVGNFLKKIRVKPFAIIAHSNGGAIAIRGLSKKLLTAERLVLLDSAGIRGQYKGRNKVVRLVTKTGKALSMPLPKRVRQRLRRKVYKTVGSDMLVAEHLQATFKRIVTDDVQADAARLNMPALLIYGEEDSSTPVQYGRMLHGLIHGSQLKIVPAAGHFVHLDKPDKVLLMLRKFLA